jgi:hypothetical protein
MQAKPLDQISKEDDIVSAFRVMLSDARESAEQRWRIIDKNWLFFQGQDYLKQSHDGQWQPDTDAPSWRHRVHRDIVRQSVETLRPILMRGYPRYVIEADFPDMEASVEMDEGRFVVPGGLNVDVATRWNELFNSHLEHENEGIDVARLLVDVLVGGVGYRAPRYDVHRNVIDSRILHYRQVLPDPYGTEIDFRDHQYVILEYERDAADIERIYHVKESDFGSDGEIIEGGGLFRRVKRLVRGSDSQGIHSDDRWSRRRYPVYEVYYNQATPEMVINDDRPPKALKFPNGRQLVIINGKKLVLDRPNPFWHGDFPVVAYQAYPLPSRFFGASDVDQMTSLQETTNLLYNMVVMNAVLSGNNQWLFEEGAILQDFVSNQPGLMIPTEMGALSRGAVQRLDAQQPPAGVFNLVRELEAFGVQDIGGAGGVLSGAEPRSGDSGRFVENLQAAAMTKQSFKVEMLDASHRRDARLRLITMQQFFEFMDPRQTRDAHRGEDLLWTEAIRELLFDVSIESRAEMPHNINLRLARAIDLYRLGIYDPEEFMRFTGIKVRPELQQALREVSSRMVPGIPAETQFQMMLQTGQSPRDAFSPQRGPQRSGVGEAQAAEERFRNMAQEPSIPATPQI